MLLKALSHINFVNLSPLVTSKFRTNVQVEPLAQASGPSTIGALKIPPDED